MIPTAEDLTTVTVADQRALEEEVAAIYHSLARLPPADRYASLELSRALHARYATAGLGPLGPGFVSLEASRVWICFWNVHSLALLGEALDPERVVDVAEFVACCQDRAGGGYGGGPGQLAHVVPTYAAVATLLELGTDAALDSINRPLLQGFLERMALPPAAGGGFAVHEGGEADLRACYCATAAAFMAGLDLAPLVQRAGLVEYVRRCQTYEGGLGGEPGNEAHGGYTYCGLAALVLAGHAGALDLRRLLHWATHMQGGPEGGFRGRTNKLVDGCYSFWQGALLPLLESVGAEVFAQSPVYRPLPGPGEVDLHAAALTAEDAEKKEAEEQAFWADPQTLETLEDLVDSISLAPLLDPQQQTQHHLRTRVAEAEDEISPLVEALMDDAERAAAAAARLFHEALPATADSEGGTGRAEAGTASTSGSAAAELFSRPLYNATALQGWLLACSQAPHTGGLRDKPGKRVDYYHTCYCLSGLAAAQHYGDLALGPGENVLRRADPRINVVEAHLQRALDRWKGAAAAPPV
jgi:protein farnesyltransferase subunit beta